MRRQLLKYIYDYNVTHMHIYMCNTQLLYSPLMFNIHFHKYRKYTLWHLQFINQMLLCRGKPPGDYRNKLFSHFIRQVDPSHDFLWHTSRVTDLFDTFVNYRWYTIRTNCYNSIMYCNLSWEFRQHIVSSNWLSRFFRVYRTCSAVASCLINHNW